MGTSKFTRGGYVTAYIDDQYSDSLTVEQHQLRHHHCHHHQHNHHHSHHPSPIVRPPAVPAAVVYNSTPVWAHPLWSGWKTDSPQSSRDVSWWLTSAELQHHSAHLDAAASPGCWAGSRAGPAADSTQRWHRGVVGRSCGGHSSRETAATWSTSTPWPASCRSLPQWTRPSGTAAFHADH